MDTWLEIAAKGCVYTAALLAVGMATSQLLLFRAQPSMPDSDGQALMEQAARRLNSMLVVTAAFLVSAIALRAVGHSIAAFGWTDGLSWENVRLIAIESKWGGGWKVQAAASVLLLTTAVVVRLRAGSLARACSFLAVVAVCASLPRTGHAASSVSGWALHSVHVLAAGLWAGTLLAIVWLGRSGLQAVQAAMLRAFASVAMTAVALLGASGAIATFTYVGTAANLIGTDYGRLLTTKIALVILMLVLGARNYRSLRASTVSTVPGTVLGEAFVAVLVIAATTWLTETAHP